jgi:hypothetical protein
VYTIYKCGYGLRVRHPWFRPVLFYISIAVRSLHSHPSQCRSVLLSVIVWFITYDFLLQYFFCHFKTMFFCMSACHWMLYNSENVAWVTYKTLQTKHLTLVNVHQINPFRYNVGPRPTLWFSCSAPMTEDVRHVFFCCVCSPAPLSEPVRRFSSCGTDK